MFWHENNNHNFLFDLNKYCTLEYLQVCWLTVTDIYEAMGNLSTKYSDTHSSYGNITKPGNMKLEYQKIINFMGKMDEWQRCKTRTKYDFDGSGYDQVLTDTTYSEQNTQMNREVYSKLALATVGGTEHHQIKQHY